MLNKRTRHIVLSALAAFILIYFLYHTVQGDRGWISMLRLQGEVREAEENLSQLQTEREALAHRVERMRPKSTDPDLLDEQARRMLNYSKPNDIIILKPKRATDEQKP